jgi:mono/diheme cytochrome c family protein
MRTLFNLLVPAMVLAACTGAQAQTAGTTYKVGKTPSAEELRTWDNVIGPEGKELPPGRGTAKEGTPIFAKKCVRCHGANGKGSVGGFASPNGPGSNGLVSGNPNWPYATTVWDFINKAMPRYQERSLTPSDVYSLTALLLYWNGIIKEDDVMDRETLPKVQMPNRYSAVPTNPDYQQYMACNPNLVKCYGSPSEK